MDTKHVCVSLIDEAHLIEEHRVQLERFKSYIDGGDFIITEYSSNHEFGCSSPTTNIVHRSNQFSIGSSKQQLIPVHCHVQFIWIVIHVFNHNVCGVQVQNVV